MVLAPILPKEVDLEFVAPSGNLTIVASSRFVDAKRLIGRRFDDPSDQSNMKHWSFKVVPGAGDKPMIVVSYKGEEKQFSAEHRIRIVNFKK